MRNRKQYLSTKILNVYQTTPHVKHIDPCQLHCGGLWIITCEAFKYHTLLQHQRN